MESTSAINGTSYHHGKCQWFVKGQIPGGSHGTCLLYGSGTSPYDHKNALPKDPQKSDPLSQQQRESELSSYTRTYHLNNYHDKGYETSVVQTNNAPYGLLGNENHCKRQHFDTKFPPGGSIQNKMIYGTDKLLQQSQDRQKRKNKENPIGFMYGTEAATNVGKPNPSRKPNNALLLEAKTFEDLASKNKKLAFDQDEFFEKHVTQKRKQWEKSQQEKKRDLEMLKSFKPWGRPGGGAPLSTDPNKQETKRTKSIKTLTQEESAPFGDVQRGGGGAPKRTESGKLQTSLHGDRELRFPVYGQNVEVDPNLRYKKDSGYRRDLEKSMDEGKARKKLEREESFEKELCHIRQYPFGSSGGGAPLRDEKGQVKSSFPITLSKDIGELRQVEARHGHAYSQTSTVKEPDPLFGDNMTYDPWGKGYGAAPRGKDGRRIRPNKHSTDDMDGICIPVGRPGAGAPIKDQDGNIKTRKVQTLTRTRFGDNISRDFSPKGKCDLIYNPFGKPGAGAPLRDDDGNVRANNIMGKVERGNRVETMSGEDTASWLRSGVVGQPKSNPVTKEIVAAHKQTSDVTRQRFNIQRQKNDSSQNYHDDLEAMTVERQQQRERDRELENKTSQEHLDTMNHLWGRPGAGAPLRKADVINARKQKLAGLAPFDEISFRFT